jgi:hypothetical protein
MIVSEKNSESKLMFLECTVAEICPHLSFLKKKCKINHAMFLECIVVVTCPYCKYRYTRNAMPRPSEECWWSDGTEGEALMGCALITKMWEQ